MFDVPQEVGIERTVIQVDLEIGKNSFQVQRNEREKEEYDGEMVEFHEVEGIERMGEKVYADKRIVEM